MLNYLLTKASKHPLIKNVVATYYPVELSNPITIEYSLLASIFAQRYYIYVTCVYVYRALPVAQW